MPQLVASLDDLKSKITAAVNSLDKDNTRATIELLLLSSDFDSRCRVLEQSCSTFSADPRKTKTNSYEYFFNSFVFT